MARLLLLAALSILIVVPAMAQVINGETPLDETSIRHEAPQQVKAADQPAMRPTAPDSTTEIYPEGVRPLEAPRH